MPSFPCSSECLSFSDYQDLQLNKKILYHVGHVYPLTIWNQMLSIHIKNVFSKQPLHVYPLDETVSVFSNYSFSNSELQMQHKINSPYLPSKIKQNNNKPPQQQRHTNKKPSDQKPTKQKPHTTHSISISSDETFKSDRQNSGVISRPSQLN